MFSNLQSSVSASCFLGFRHVSLNPAQTVLTPVRYTFLQPLGRGCFVCFHPNSLIYKILAWDWGFNSVVKCLLSMYRVWVASPAQQKNQQNKKHCQMFLSKPSMWKTWSLVLIWDHFFSAVYVAAQNTVCLWAVTVATHVVRPGVYPCIYQSYVV